ncbi:hypothetical protein D3C75_1247270 [compost metagenome]
MQTDGAILRIELAFIVTALQGFRRGADQCVIFQLQHVVLNGVQQAISRDLDKGVHLLHRLHL